MKYHVTRCAAKGIIRMRGIIIVETQEEFTAWLASQKSQYSAAHPETAPAQNNNSQLIQRRLRHVNLEKIIY